VRGFAESPSLSGRRRSIRIREAARRICGIEERNTGEIARMNYYMKV
jgi:hypothetical protein